MRNISGTIQVPTLVIFLMVNKTKLKYSFNLRDIKLFSTFEDNSEEGSNISGPVIVHNIIISCFKNGILFFQVSARSLENFRNSLLNDPKPWIPILDFENKLSQENNLDWTKYKDSNILELTHRVDFSEAGRLFTFSDYSISNSGVDDTPFYIYITHSAKPSVYELSINSHFNLNSVRLYTVYSDYTSRLVGSDVLSVNKVYIAHLMFDLERMIEIVRIYYRDSSNFAYGHTNILLKSFVTRISAISFLDYSNNPFIFVQNACKGALYKINDLKFEIDTTDLGKEYDKYVNKTYKIDLFAYNQEKLNQNASMTVKISFVDNRDMTTYFVGTSDIYYFGYNYGDSSFSKPISSYFVGPDLKFNLTLKSDSEYIRSLVLPNITNTQEKSNIREFHTIEEWSQSFFNRYTNIATGTENIAFYCIQNSAIEEHIFRTKDLIETKKETYSYDRYSFVDFYVNLYDDKDVNNFTDLLVVLGIIKIGKQEKYFLHYFDLKNDIITWKEKVFIFVIFDFRLLLTPIISNFEAIIHSSTLIKESI